MALPEIHIISNIVVVLVLALSAWAARFVLQNRLWRGAFAELWRRRWMSLIVIAVYGAIGLADSVAWVGGGNVQGSDDVVAQHQARTIIDRAVEMTSLGVTESEASYSAPFAETSFYNNRPLQAPGGHWLGTDILGRDIVHRVLKGVRVALLIGGFTSMIAVPLALLLGILAGYFGRRIDDAVFFVISTLASIPSILLLIALIIVLGRETVYVCIALGITSWVGLCRVVRGETLKLRELDYVQAARALGVSHLRIISRHILPNLMHLVIITFVLLFSQLVLSEAILAYLGIGVDGSWGKMIAQANTELSREPIIWWNISAAGVAMFTLLLAVNYVGDALRDILDPRTVREEL